MGNRWDAARLDGVDLFIADRNLVVQLAETSLLHVVDEALCRYVVAVLSRVICDALRQGQGARIDLSRVVSR